MKIQFPDLPYAINSLDECIDSQTMDLHYNKHHRGYYEKFITAIEKVNTEEIENLEQLFKNISIYEPSIRNNGGGLYNHSFFWNCMTPDYRDCTGTLRVAIEKKWKTMAGFEKSFSDVASNHFASGWAWLIVDNNRELQIVETANHDNPLMDVCPTKGFPILVLDVWEHAYYLRYKNERSAFINAWWDIVNWKHAEERYATLFK
ncbi:MAG: superoxide dismutase [Bacteriovorax sp.]|nr:superoxide dismutase [Bacteriovorax sp.]